MADTCGYKGLKQVGTNPAQEHPFYDASEETPSSSGESSVTNPYYEQARHGSKWFFTGLMCTGVALILCLWGHGTLNAHKAVVQEVVTYDVTMTGTENADSLPSCSWSTDALWHPLTSADERAMKAVNAAFKLASVKRHQCKPALGDLDWEPANFVRDVETDFHMEISHKFSGDCSGEAYNMKFEITNVQSFELEVHRDRLTGIYSLSNSKPDLCQMNVETSSAPRIVDANNPDVKKAAEFAMGELNFHLHSPDCLDIPKKEFKLANIDSALTTVMSGVKYTLTVGVYFDGTHYPSATLNVVQRCGLGLNKCVLQLLLPEGVDKWCDIATMKKLLEASKSTRRLGATDEDKTETYASQKRMLYPRRLDDKSKDPLRERYIKTGDVPEAYSPLDDVTFCYEQVPVYQQGDCAACYANAYAQMMGIRACIQATKAKDKDKKKKDDRRLGSSARQLGDDCKDDATWAAYGAPTINCAFFAQHGCDDYSDFGQLTHCKESCKVCDKVKAEDDPPSKDAKYIFMPSATDLASCSVGPTGTPRGCGGGSMWDIWNNYLSKAETLNTMADKCMPNKLKCFSNADVMNPLRSKDACDGFKDYDTWDKPCSCIDDEDKPTELPTCPSESPKAACQFKVPAASFVVLGVAGGLSSADAVLNFQRHIVEYGPVYVTILVQSAFINWDFNKHEVYIGSDDSKAIGGHAMIATGWGESPGVPYWIIRNSWGSDWADKGSCLFLRGSNLDGIENHGGVTMPTDDFKDWSAPVCRVTSWSRKWSFEGSTLYKYNLATKFRCNEKAKLKVFYSAPMTGTRDSISKSGATLTGVEKEFDAPKQEEVDGPVIDMSELGFGTKDGDMWIDITSTDSDGNSAETSNFLSIPKVPGMLTIQNI